jgi:uncharacterized repeat protein (TIGR04076 family)
MPNKFRITVVRKIDTKEIYGKRMPEIKEDFPTTCTLWEEGKKFIVEEDGKMPAEFCTWAWRDIYKDLSVLRFGGNFPWITKPGIAYTCCTDGLRPVVFKIEKIQ